MDLLQKWWEEKYPNAGVKLVKDVSDGILTNEMFYDFEAWLNINYDVIELDNNTKSLRKVKYKHLNE